MPIRHRAAEITLRWHAGLLAGRALTAAVYGEHRRSRALTALAVSRGPAAVERLVTVWCRTILDEHPPGTGVRPDIERAPAPARWTARVLAAVAARDRITLSALVGAVPADELEPRLTALLHLAVDAVVERDEEICL
ncbi:hypothetical protein HUT06_17650 [Actinomadura sp. NAK00032]|uniref:hypothetical protein n=1 Tax=Actinomadura sp. NAK00032 TaxID=2742128 RepID=UPI00159156FA|nr:hypothetical protein [Actinomadura sp. NAK00032]QKW35638.1 hypothetical protein HUT06_17650 [Actinomadura sp. NAK00032]